MPPRIYLQTIVPPGLSLELCFAQGASGQKSDTLLNLEGWSTSFGRPRHWRLKWGLLLSIFR